MNTWPKLSRSIFGRLQDNDFPSSTTHQVKHMWSGHDDDGGLCDRRWMVCEYEGQRRRGETKVRGRKIGSRRRIHGWVDRMSGERKEGGRGTRSMDRSKKEGLLLFILFVTCILLGFVLAVQFVSAFFHAFGYMSI